ncbi:HD family phosphohydrolase [Roseospirillum parvum]|uniref:HD-GYP domain, c-di-GMP phosphodiesterase class II (Or its inactivated variant) n=1 Tax=Roseospirillum parvum TaxID=83401 RepID=A0A1G7UW87_9PROT|nr:HD family phosphohydrolase [Roseospirillum parvum]SDG51551.1 HD-GYP domain, c-di-GMP phosphodiesterase class II (or its inactivated variant) [Roseospirillum parvum]
MSGNGSNSGLPPQQGAGGSPPGERRYRRGRRLEDQKSSRLHRLIELGIALSAERDHDRLLERILLEAKDLANSDGGTLYLVTEDRKLAFAILRNDTLNTAMGGTTGVAIPLPPVNLYNPETGQPNYNNVASSCALGGKTISIDDAYTAEGYDFSGTKKFDQGTGYRSKSFLNVPMKNYQGEVIAVLQLINARDDDGRVVPFDIGLQPIIEALASQAAVAIDNQQLISAQRDLLDSMIKVIARAIDAKSPYTGGHCERVPVIAKMLAEAGCAEDSGPFADYQLNDDQWYELHLAAWLHDCGKVTTPEYVVDKATKLETIWDRIHEVRTRFEVLRRDAEIAYLKARLAGGDEASLGEAYAARCAELEEQFAFIAEANIGGEFMAPEKISRLREIGAQTFMRTFDRTLGVSWAERQRLADKPPPPAPAEERLLEDRPDHLKDIYNLGELYNLSIQRGTLTEEERKVINDHIVITQEMLDQLPFPRHLKRVPVIAGNHHEKMDGSGYPRGLKGAEMGVSERIMAVADIFEALTAADRPYKQPKKLSEAIRILSFMKKDNHIDGDIFELFLRSGAYKAYAERFLRPEQIDEVDISSYLAG